MVSVEMNIIDANQGTHESESFQFDSVSTNQVGPAPSLSEHVLDRHAEIIVGKAEAKEINTLHAALNESCARVSATVVTQAIALGKMLKATKKLVGHGNWTAWVDGSLQFSMKTATRYMSLAKAKETGLSDLQKCATLMEAYAFAGVSPASTTTPSLKLFTPQAVNILNLAPEAISAGEKDKILKAYEDLDRVAVLLVTSPTVFSPTWKKKLDAPANRWTLPDLTLFKTEVETARVKIASVEEELQFETNAPASTSLDQSLPVCAGAAL